MQVGLATSSPGPRHQKTPQASREPWSVGFEVVVSFRRGESIHFFRRWDCGCVCAAQDWERVAALTCLCAVTTQTFKSGFQADAVKDAFIRMDH